MQARGMTKAEMQKRIENQDKFIGNHQKHATEIVANLKAKNAKLEAKNATLKRRVAELEMSQSSGVNWKLLREEGK